MMVELYPTLSPFGKGDSFLSLDALDGRGKVRVRYILPAT
jgi:hypothetical protein